MAEPRLPPPGAEAVYPVSPMQEAMLFHSLAGDPGAYVGQLSCTLTGELDPAAFAGAWQAVVDRHPALRTSFLVSGVERPLQVVHRRVAVPVAEEDLRGVSAEQRAERLASFLARDRLRPFDLERPPLMRLHLFRVAERATRWVWTRHHALIDGWSVNLLADELEVLYGALRDGREATLPPAVPYRRFIDWLAARDAAGAERFWRRELAGLSSPTAIAGDAHLRRGEGPRVSLVEERRPLGGELGQRARRLASSSGITLATVLSGAWALLLDRYGESGAASGGEVVFGMTFSGRPAELPGVESIVGLFLNTLPVRVRIAPRARTLPWLRGLQDLLADIRQHEHAPLVELRRFTEVPAERELFTHILVLEDYPLGTAGSGPATFADLRIDDYRFIDQTSLPLNVGVVAEDELTMLVVYDPERFSRGLVRRLMESYATVLGSLVAPGEAHLGELAVLSESERQALARLNDTVVDWPDRRSVVERFAACAAVAPDAVALSFADRVVSYGALAHDVAALAARLRRRGVGREGVVAICLERSPELPMAVLAVLLAGGAFLPLDPQDPGERLLYMARDAGAALVVTTADLAGVFTAAGVAVETIPGPGDEAPVLATGLAPDTAHAAYVLYTSGSTGRPKAVVNTHGALTNRLLWMQSAYPIGSGDRVLQKTPITFDVSVWELLWPLIEGAEMVLAEPGGHRDPGYLGELLVRHRVTVAHFVPSMLRVFLAAGPAAGGLRHLIASGEALAADLATAARERLGATVHNLYGPTEAAIDVTFHDCDRPALPAVPIGRPIANTRILLLDRLLRPVPWGTVGEIFIGGAGLARGYLGRPALTAGRFLPDPGGAEPGGRLYRSGDLARLDEEGRVVFVGRADFQVKVRGMRVELGEIEAALRRCPGVRQAVVLADGSGPEEARLVAHLVTAGEAAAEASLTEGIRHRLAAELPASMIPARIAFHAALPLLANGKLDRAALAAGADAVPLGERRIEPPRTPVEEELAAIWREVLELPEVGIRESFFVLGGHSLLLAQVGARIARSFGIELPIRRLFNAPTIVAMTEAVLEGQLAEEDPDEVARLTAELRHLSPQELAELLAEEAG